MKKILFLLVFLPLITVGQIYKVNNNNAYFDGNKLFISKIKVTDSLLIDGEMIYEQPIFCAADTTNQITSVITKAYKIRFSTNIITDSDISHNAGDSIFTFHKAGEFFISWSGIFASSAPNKTVNIWICKNGSNIALSNTIFQLLGTAQERLATVTYIEQFAVNDTFSIFTTRVGVDATLKECNLGRSSLIITRIG